MKIKRDESHCYAAVITEDGQWQKGEVYTCKTTYRYDNHGNWIEKRIEYSKRYTNLIVEQTIEYANE